MIDIFSFCRVEDIIQVLILFTLECLESDRVLLYSERHSLLRVLPVLVVLATSGEKEGESIFKKIKISRLMNTFKVLFFPMLFVFWSHHDVFSALGVHCIKMCNMPSLSSRNFLNSCMTLSIPLWYHLAGRQLSQ